MKPEHLGPTIDGLLTSRAGSGAVFLRFGSGDITFADAATRVERLAGGLAVAGIGTGDTVAVVMPNVPEHVLSFFALCRLGAIGCLVNTAFRGPALQHAFAVTGPKLILTHSTTHAEVVATVAAMPERPRIVDIDEWAVLASGAESPPPQASHSPRDPALILFTSGTTGPSKGCVLPHRYLVRQAELMVEHLEFTSSDVFYCPFPLFHIDATVLTIGPALVLGTTAAIGERFSVSGFWDEVRRMEATVFDFMGATLTLLYKQPTTTEDSNNPLRLGWGVPVPEFASHFEQRFGVTLVELYGSTDAGLPIYHPPHEPRREGSCGRLIDAYEAAVLDVDGFEVASGKVGELAIRPREPSLMSMGYVGMDGASLASRRDLWFHTGDLVRRDNEGFFYFVGRRADSIRRRGENISAFEVEEAIRLHPDVVDVAAFGVPSALTEDDLMVAVVPRPHSDLTPESVVRFCEGRLARHMVPRYVDIVTGLPLTPTEKVRKDELRAAGVTPSTWDRERPLEP